MLLHLQHLRHFSVKQLVTLSNQNTLPFWCASNEMLPQHKYRQRQSKPPAPPPPPPQSAPPVTCSSFACYNRGIIFNKRQTPIKQISLIGKTNYISCHKQQQMTFGGSESNTTPTATKEANMLDWSGEPRCLHSHHYHPGHYLHSQSHHYHHRHHLSSPSLESSSMFDDREEAPMLPTRCFRWVVD